MEDEELISKVTKERETIPKRVLKVEEDVWAADYIVVDTGKVSRGYYAASFVDEELLKAVKLAKQDILHKFSPLTEREIKKLKEHLVESLQWINSLQTELESSQRIGKWYENNTKSLIKFKEDARRILK